MKIGIVSMQRIKNNGSYLQAYGLYNIVKKYGHDVEFIDFYNELHNKNIKNNVSVKNLLRKIKHFIIPKYRHINSAKKSSKIFCEKIIDYYSLIGMSEELNLADKFKHYDLVIIGSDEVFNICQFTDGKKSIPWELFGENISADKIISYAASCGQTDLKGIEQINETEHVSVLLNKFSGLSVRDDNTYNVVKTLSNREPVYCIDPVLLYDEFPIDDSYKKINEPYLLIYAYTMRMSNPQEINAIKKFAKKKKLKIVCVNVFQSWCDYKVVTSPFALLQYIKDAAYVVTDTFHGSVFSIRNNTPFAVIIRNSNKNKLTFLLEQFKLTDRLVDNTDNLEDILNTEINFANVNEMLIEKRKYAFEYLDEFLLQN